MRHLSAFFVSAQIVMGPTILRATRIYRRRSMMKWTKSIPNFRRNTAYLHVNSNPLECISNHHHAVTSRTFLKVEKLWTDPHNASAQIQSIVFSKSKPKLVSNKIKYCKLIAKIFICCVYVSFQKTHSLMF